MRSTNLANMAIASLIGTVSASSHQHFHESLQLRQAAPVSQGCFSSQGGGMQSQGSYTWQSSLHCAGVCQALNMPVMALFNTNECACGDLLPDSASKVSSSECSYKCTGWAESCGGPGNFYTVFLTGISSNVGSVSGPDASASSSSAEDFPSSSSTVAPSTVVKSVTQRASTTVVHQQTTIFRGAQETIIRTVGPSSTAATFLDQNKSVSSGAASHSSTGTTVGIAVGVVAGILGLAALIGAAAFYARRRRRMKNAENGHARADSLNAFVASGGTLPGVGQRKFSITDSRLDPRMMVETRRQSAGSVFADNEDYSRRILKVANPDDL